MMVSMYITNVIDNYGVHFTSSCTCEQQIWIHMCVQKCDDVHVYNKCDSVHVYMLVFEKIH